MRMLLLPFAALLACAAAPVGLRAQAPTQKCSAAADTATLPPLSQVADSAALLSALGTAAPGASPVVLLRVGYGRNGRPEEVEAYGRSGEAGAPGPIRKTLLPLFHALPGRDGEFGFWIARTDGTPGQLSLARPRVECAPVLINRDELTQMLSRAYQSVRARNRQLPASGVVGVVKARIDSRGEPVRVVLRESTRIPELDAEALRIARRMRFVPSRVDDVPVGVWVTMPMRFYVM